MRHQKQQPQQPTIASSRPHSRITTLTQLPTACLRQSSPARFPCPHTPRHHGWPAPSHSARAIPAVIVFQRVPVASPTSNPWPSVPASTIRPSAAIAVGFTTTPSAWPRSPSRCRRPPGAARPRHRCPPATRRPTAASAVIQLCFRPELPWSDFCELRRRSAAKARPAFPPPAGLRSRPAHKHDC